MEDLYCKVFINTIQSIKELTEKISVCLHLEHDKFFSIEGDYFSVDVIKNKEFDEEKSKEFPDGFLYFPYFLDIDTSDCNKSSDYKKEIRKLLVFLWKEGYQVVASCDFENELSCKGGYNQGIKY